jgi:aminopeptidase-like protein
VPSSTEACRPPDNDSRTGRIGQSIHSLATQLWPLNRSLTGDGVRQSLQLIEKILPGLKTYEVPTGTEACDWIVPDEWNVREAWIECPDGQRIVDFKNHNLHLVGYSMPVDITVDLETLQQHLYSAPERPDAIPYVTSYYSPYWGFCVRHTDRLKLRPGSYRVRIDATLEPGSMTYADLVLPGTSTKEIMLSTYVCHPSMANNELSGPCVTTYLMKWLSEQPQRYYTYRAVFVPETIGSIYYVSKHLSHLQQNVVAGFNVTCVGDDRCYSFLPSRNGNTLADRAALHVLKHVGGQFRRYTFLDRGSDESQYCAPGVDLPVATLMRSKYGEYPEYHTSDDDLQLITPSGLESSFDALRLCLEIIEHNYVPRMTVIGEPQMGRRGLYPSINTMELYNKIRPMMDMIAYADGRHSLLEIAEIIGVPAWELPPICRKLFEHGLIEDPASTRR